MLRRGGLPGLAAAAALYPALPGQDAALVLGSGSQRYEWDGDWMKLPGKGHLGATHGDVAVAADGTILVTTDTRRAVLRFQADGTFLGWWGEEFHQGLHGATLVKEEDGEFLYLCHLGKSEVAKATLDGEVLWRRGYPEEAGIYTRAEEFRPTSVAVAPGGEYFVADGYGKSWIHKFDPDGTYLLSFGGPGEEPGKLNTPHGLCIDRRGREPTLLVADRENHRLQVFDLDGRPRGVIGGLRRPCGVEQSGEYLVVPDLAGRVTILDGKNEVVVHLGENPDPAKWARNDVPPEEWQDGCFLAPHAAAWDAQGNLYVMDWSQFGRVTRLSRT